MCCRPFNGSHVKNRFYHENTRNHTEILKGRLARRFPAIARFFLALATMERERGNPGKALGYAEKFVAIAPDNRGARALLREFHR